MERIAQEHTIRLLTIDIGEWGSPVAKQYGIEKLPTLWLFRGEDLVSDDYGEILQKYGR